MIVLESSRYTYPLVVTLRDRDKFISYRNQLLRQHEIIPPADVPSI